MLGSHNSLTSYSCPWYLRVFNAFARCQSKTLEEQLKAGVQFFDLRIKMRADGSYCFAHGLMKYKAPALFDLIRQINDFGAQNNKEMYFRVMLEYNKEPKDLAQILPYFESLFPAGINKCYFFVHFCGAYQKWDYKEIVEAEVDLPITHKYSSCIGWKRFIHCIPYLYAKKRNGRFKEQYKEQLQSGGEVLLLDFV